MSLPKVITDWDGRSTVEISAAYDEFCTDPVFVDDLIEYLGSQRTQVGASWLLKKHLEAGFQVDFTRANRVFGKLRDIPEPWARLHLLQMIELLPIGPESVEEVERFVREDLQNTRSFLRAWSLHGFAELARRFPEYKEEAMVLLEDAAENGTAAVKARVRNIFKKGFCR